MTTTKRYVSRARHAWIVLFVLLIVSALRAHQQTRETSAPIPPTGTGRIAGVVTDAQAQPVHNAIVTLTGAELGAGRAAITDQQGGFSFERLPAGRFSLSSSKPAYLKATYGAVRPGGTGTTITLVAEEQLTGIKLTMPHGGAIAGIIRNSKGEPVPGIRVSVVRTGAPLGAPAPAADAANTDDRGAYRVFGLLPGTYGVVAAPTFSGGLGEVGVMSTADVDAVLLRLQQRGARGATQKAPPESSASSIVRPTQTFSTAPVFFPGVTSANVATVISLGIGEERGGIDFVYQLARAAAVGGTVSGAGSLQNVQISLTVDGVSFQIPQGVGAGPMLQRRSTTGDGAFTFTNVTPGKYTLMARTSGAPAPQGGRGSAPPSSGVPVLFAMTTVDVTGEDISGLALTLQPAPHVGGRLTFQATAMTPPGDLTKIRVLLTPMNPTTSLGVGPNGVVTPSPQIGSPVHGDGTFELDGVIPGAYRIRTMGEPGGWWPKAAAFSGRDLFDVPLEVASNDVTGIEITLSDQHSQLSGHLLQSNGVPAAGYFVIAFSADRSLWLPQSRRLRSVRPSTDGQFRLDDLPAGEYYLAALTDADSDEWQAPAFLAQAMVAAVKVTLGDGERKTQDLRIGR